MEPPRERGHLSGRTRTSCFECKRRKQRCDRQWPCNHCQARNSAHLCQFKVSSGLADGVKNDERSPRKRQAESVDGSTYSSQTQDYQHLDGKNTLKALGYLGSDIFPATNGEGGNETAENSMVKLPEEIKDALRTVPPRPYADSLVKNFFERVNYHYCIVHQLSFVPAYRDWWLRRRQPHSTSIPIIVFTCLVLRICANSTQFLPATMIAELESELGDSINRVGESYQRAAQKLSAFVTPGAGGITQVQQLFLGATWLKSEAEFIESWHALGAAVREAQEIGMHKDDTYEDMKEFDMEMRRRVWCGLFTWDRFMAAVLNRPFLIDKKSPITLPNPRLDQQATQLGIPSPILAKTLECELAQQLSVIAASSTAPTQSSLSTMVKYVENWMELLPPSFKINNPDKQYDVDHPRIIFQRLQLHCTGYMSILLLLKPYLVSMNFTSWVINDNEKKAETRHSITYAIDTSLELMSKCTDFFTNSFPDSVKYFMISFCPFDTAALLCSVLLKDKTHTIPRRLEVVEAIGKALYISSCLRGLTKMGDATWNILARLTAHLELDLEEKTILENTTRHGDFEHDTDSNVSGNYIEHNGDTTGVSELHQQVNIVNSAQPFDNHGFDMGDAIRGDEVGIGNLSSDMNLGVLEGIWDYEALQFDPYLI